MYFLPAIHHTLEIAGRSFPHGADVYMNDQKQGNQKAHHNVKLGCEKYTRHIKKLSYNKLREKKRPSCNK